MAQVITTGFGGDPPSLEELLVTSLQVGAKKPRGEIEIDVTTPAVGGSASVVQSAVSLNRDAVNATFGSPCTAGNVMLACLSGEGVHPSLDPFPQAGSYSPSGWVWIGSLEGVGSNEQHTQYARIYGKTSIGGETQVHRIHDSTDQTMTILEVTGINLGDVVDSLSVASDNQGNPATFDLGTLTGDGWAIQLTTWGRDHGAVTVFAATPGTGWTEVSEEDGTFDVSQHVQVRDVSGSADATMSVTESGGAGIGTGGGVAILFGTGSPAGVATETIQVESMSYDRSRKMVAAQLDVALDNELSERGWYTQASTVFVPNNPVRAYAWLGDRANRVCVFTGLFDRIAEHRNPKSLAVKARSRMKWMLEQGFVATAPQGADDDGAVRTEDNGVYIGKSPEYIAGDILDRAGWPSADRSIGTSGITLAEYLLADRSDWASQIAGSFRLTTATGWDFWEDELGIAHFEPSPLIAGSEPTADWDFQAGVNVMALDHETDDEDRATRVEVSGPMTSAVPKWAEVWRTSILKYPAGIWYDPADPDNIRVIDRVTKYIYTIAQSDRHIVSKHYLGGYPLGLSGDPTDGTHYYVLNAPWRNTGSTSGNSLKEYRTSDNALLNTYSLPNGRWTGMKTDGTNVFLTNYDDGKIYTRSMTGGAVASDSTVYQSVAQTHPTGLWLNGTTMGVFFSGSKRFLLMDTSDIGTVTGTQSTKGTIIAGGEADTDTDIDLYADADAGSFGLTSGLIAKFTLAELVTKDVSALSIDYDLEDALGLQSGIAARDHGDCPNDASPHPYEARLAGYDMEVVQSLTQAQDVADAQLALLSRLRRVMDLGTTGHPAVQVNDVIRYQDAVAGIDAKWIIDSYRASIGQTYTQTMSVLPWEAA